MKKILIVILILIIAIVGYTVWKYSTTPTPPVTPIVQSTAPTKTLTAITPKSPLLSATGIGDVAFGTSADTTVATFTTLFGTPTKDTGWVSSFSSYGTCPGTTLRVVEWNRLHVFFGDTPFGQKSFFHYEYTDHNATTSAPILATNLGLTIGTTDTQLKSWYPGVKINGYEESTWSGFVIATDAKTNTTFGGIMDSGIGNKVFWIDAGISCGE